MKILLGLVCAASLVFGQEKKEQEPSKYYRLEFVVKELEGGKLVNARTYVASISTPDTRAAEIRAGEKVPFGTTSADAGVNIDCMKAQTVGDRLALVVVADISSFAPGAEKGSMPVIRQTRVQATALVPLKKPTPVFSSDEPFSKGQLQLEVTATPLN